MRLQTLQDPAASGETLMARDYELLELAAGNSIGPTLRFYRWLVPTISLGYHQSTDLLDMERITRSNIPWVRRPTGGAAVLHSEELTYAIVMPNLSDGKSSSGIQKYVGNAIAGGLQALGVMATVEERGEPLSALPNRTSCFVRTSRWEVSVRGRKLVGSAQRKLGHAILQHGSIIIGDDHLRLVEFLSLQNESIRGLLRERLIGKSTSISTELECDVSDSELREVFAQSFHDRFADFLIEQRERETLV